MLLVHDTYRVTWAIGNGGGTLRVSDSELMSMLSILVFNKAKSITVEFEVESYTITTAGTGITLTGSS